MITISKIIDPFQPEISTTEIVDYDVDKKLYHYVSDLPFNDKDITFVIALNGIIIEYEYDTELFIHVVDGSYISICAKVEFEAASYIGAYVASALVTAGATATAAAAVGWAVTATAYLAIGYGVNKLLGALAPDMPSQSVTDSTTEQIYGWGELSQTNQQGIQIPYVYGTNRMSGNIINQFTDVDEDGDETLYALLGLCDNSVDEITDIRVNNQPIEYYEGITSYTRNGYVDDAVIPYFNEVVDQTDVGSKLATDVARTYATNGDCEKIVVRITAPNGLYHLNDYGNPEVLLAAYKVKYKNSLDSTYITHSVVVCGHWETINTNVITTNFDGFVSTADNGYGKKYIFNQYVSEVQKELFISDNLDIFNAEYDANAGTHDSKSYKTTIDDLPLSTYNIQVTKISDDVESSKKRSDLYISSYQERIKQNLIYPGIAKYAVMALATDQLSGGMPSFSCEVSNLYIYNIYVPDTASWTSGSAFNPAWIVYDLLVNKAGISPLKMIYEEFNAWATWCEDSDLLIGGLVVTGGNFWSEVQRISSIGRASIIRRGIKYGVFIDKADTAVSHMFNNGNIIDNTTTVTWLPKADIANAIEVEYIDPDRDYTRQVATVISSNTLNSTDATDRKTTIQINAAITQQQAINEGIYRINCNKYLTKTIKFKAFIDSFSCTVGDIFYFQQDLPQVKDGDSGRILVASNDGTPYITIDKNVILEDNVEYFIRVRLSNGDIIDKKISPIDIITPNVGWSNGDVAWDSDIIWDTDTEQNVPEEDLYWAGDESWAIGTAWDITQYSVSGNTFYVDSEWDVIPSKYDLYSIGTISAITNKYRLIEVTNQDDFVRELTGLNYIDEVYTDRSGTIISEPYWDQSSQQAVSVNAKEVMSFSGDNSYKSTVDLSWQRNEGTYDIKGWDIYIKDITAGTSPVIIAKDIRRFSATLSYNYILGREYEFYIVPTTKGYYTTGDNYTSITIEGQIAEPSAVTSLVVDYDFTPATQVNFRGCSWDIVDPVTNYYEIRFYSTNNPLYVFSWEGAAPLETTSPGAISMTSNLALSKVDPPIINYIAIKTVSSSGVYSDDAYVVATTIE